MVRDKKHNKIYHSKKMLISTIVVLIIIVVFLAGFASSMIYDANAMDIKWIDISNPNYEYITDISWSPDSQKIVVTHGYDKGSIYLYNASTGNKTELLLNLPDTYFSQFTATSWSPINKNIIFFSGKDIVVKYNLSSSEYDIIHYNSWNTIPDIAISPDGQKIAFPSAINLPSGQTINNYSTLGGPIEIIDITNNVTVGLINLYNYGIFSFDYMPKKVYWSPNGTKIAIITEGGKLFISDSSSIMDDLVSNISLHNIIQINTTSFITDMAWSPSSSQIVSLDRNNGFSSGNISIWDVENGKLIRKGTMDGINWFGAIDWSSENNIIVTGQDRVNGTCGFFIKLIPDDLSSAYLLNSTQLLTQSAPPGDIEESPDGLMMCASYGQKLVLFTKQQADINGGIAYSSGAIFTFVGFGISYLIINKKNNSEKLNVEGDKR